jgi:hypothetical protein
VPPVITCKSPNGTTPPPSTATFAMRFPSQNATQRPSGEKNGFDALSVPGSSVADGWSNRRV